MTTENLINIGYLFGINLISIIIISRFIYYPRYKNKDFLFTFNVFNLVIFGVCAVMFHIKVDLGFAFGLFAVFSILRYRTVTIPIREMGYFFLCISVGFINALLSSQVVLLLSIFANVLLVLMVYFLDANSTLKHENVKYIVVDKLEYIEKSKHELLIAELKLRTGYDFHKVEVTSIDFFKETAKIKAYYYSQAIETDYQDGQD